MQVKEVFSGFSVKDLEETKSFYREKLGLNVEEDKDGMGLWIHLPEGGKVFGYPKDNHEPATYTMLNLVVDNIDSAVEELKSKGVEFEHYEGMTGEDGIARGSEKDMGPDIAWFKDPSGNILSVIQDSDK